MEKCDNLKAAFERLGIFLRRVWGMMSAIETIKAIFLFNYEYKNIRWFTR